MSGRQSAGDACSITSVFDTIEETASFPIAIVLFTPYSCRHTTRSEDVQCPRDQTAMAQDTRAITAEELFRMPGDGYQHELVAGGLRKMRRREVFTASWGCGWRMR
jgi:hypothetical protein